MHNRPFTDEEFDIMIEQTCTGKVTYDMLCDIINKTLAPSVHRWCAGDYVLSKNDNESDLMSEIRLKIMQNVVTHFLKKDGVINRDPDGFQKWMFVVAKRVMISKVKREKNLMKRFPGLEEGEENNIPDSSSLDDYDDGDDELLLQRCFGIVLDADMRVYKSMTWLAYGLFIMDLELSTIEAKDAIVKAFSERTLYDMKATLLRLAEKYEWIVITQEQMDRIDDALAETIDNVHVGDMKYKDFFMIKGGKKSVSDWINRVNNLIDRKIKNETPND